MVAETLEQARHAARLVRVEYQAEPYQTDLLAALDDAHLAPASLPEPRGDCAGALAGAALRIEGQYSSPIEHHNPMEPHAATVVMQPDGALLVYDKTQGTQNSQQYIERVFGLEPGRVRVMAPFVGGAFGSGLRPQYQLVLAVMAALAAALGAGDPDPATDVQLRLPPAHRAAPGPGRRRQRRAARPAP